MKLIFTNWRRPAATVLLWIAAGISLMLAWRATKLGALPGCADGADCQSVLASTHGKILGIPAGWWGVALYGLLNLTSGAWVRRENSGAAVIGGVLAGVAAGGAAWFIFVQAVLLKQWCPWCLAVHLSALSTVLLLDVERRRSKPPEPAKGDRRILLSGFASSLVGLVFTAWLGGALKSRSSMAAVSAAASESSSIALPPMAPLSWVMSLDGAPLKLDLSLLPVMGPLHAARTAVLLTDYTCPHCRSYEPVVESMVSTQNPPLRVVTMPASRDEAGAAVQRVMLTLFQADRKHWLTLHQQLLAGTLDPLPAIVADAAKSLMGEKAWSDACATHETVVNQLLNAGQRIQQANRIRFPEPKLPQLIAGTEVLMGAESDPAAIAKFLEASKPVPAPAVAAASTRGGGAPKPFDRPLGLSLTMQKVPSLGNLAPGGKKRVTLSIQNQSGLPLTIQRADMGPGCLLVSLPGTPVAPATSVNVVLEYTAPARPGAFSETVLLHTTGQPLRAVLQGTVTSTALASGTPPSRS